jgi:NMD protein affecting ribosome stability and mRNA decay
MSEPFSHERSGPERSRRIKLPHRHRGVSTHVLVQRAGVPYELERTVCSECARVLSERPLRRTAA